MAVIVTDKFYTYTWLRKDGTPYYIGKGTKCRAFLSCKGHRPPRKENIIVQDHASEADAFAAEIFLIAYYGRKDLGTGCLRNLTDGGDGVSGYKFSEEGKRRNGLLKRGNRYRRGCVLSENTKQKISVGKQGTAAWNKGRALSPEHRASLRKPHKAFTKASMSEEHKKAIRVTLRAKVTPEVIETMRWRGQLGAAARWGKV